MQSVPRRSGEHAGSVAVCLQTGQGIERAAQLSQLSFQLGQIGCFRACRLYHITGNRNGNTVAVPQFQHCRLTGLYSDMHVQRDLRCGLLV